MKNKKLQTIILYLVTLISFVTMHLYKVITNEAPDDTIIKLQAIEFSLYSIINLTIALYTCYIIFIIIPYLIGARIKKYKDRKRENIFKVRSKQAVTFIALSISLLMPTYYFMGKATYEGIYENNKLLQEILFKIKDQETFTEITLWGDFTRRHAAITGDNSAINSTDFSNLLNSPNMLSSATSPFGPSSSQFLRMAEYQFAERNQPKGFKVYSSKKCILMPYPDGEVVELLCRDIHKTEKLKPVDYRLIHQISSREHLPYKFVYSDFSIEESNSESCDTIYGNILYHSNNLSYTLLSPNESCSGITLTLKDEKLVIPPTFEKDITPADFKFGDIIYYAYYLKRIIF